MRELQAIAETYEQITHLDQRVALRLSRLAAQPIDAVVLVY